MIPDSIILLTPEARLDALLYALEGARRRFREQEALGYGDDAADALVASWEAVHDELMRQISPKEDTGNADI